MWGGTHCMMVFGNGPNGLGWYWVDTEGCDHRGSLVPSRTCEESCVLTCQKLCEAKVEEDDGMVAEDRGYGYGRGYSYTYRSPQGLGKR